MKNTERINEDRVADVARLFRANLTWNQNDAATNLSDLLADLMHWADAKRIDFGMALLRARGHYEEESA